MKPGDVKMIYAMPFGEINPVGNAKLIELVESWDTAEYWKVEFIQTGKTERVIIKK